MDPFSYVGHHDTPFGKIKNKSNKFIKKKLEKDEQRH